MKKNIEDCNVLFEELTTTQHKNMSWYHPLFNSAPRATRAFQDKVSGRYESNTLTGSCTPTDDASTEKSLIRSSVRMAIAEETGKDLATKGSMTLEFGSIETAEDFKPKSCVPLPKSGHPKLLTNFDCDQLNPSLLSWFGVPPTCDITGKVCPVAEQVSSLVKAAIKEKNTPTKPRTTGSVMGYTN